MEWNPNDHIVTIDKGIISLTLSIGVALPDGMGMPEIVGGRTFVPIAYVANELGATVRWDADTRAVYVYQ